MQRKPSHFGSNTSSTSGSESKPGRALASIGLTGGLTGSAMGAEAIEAPVGSEGTGVDPGRAAGGGLGQLVEQWRRLGGHHEALEVAGLEEALADGVVEEAPQRPEEPV